MDIAGPFRRLSRLFLGNLRILQLYYDLAIADKSNLLTLLPWKSGCASVKKYDLANNRLFAR